MEKFLSIKEVVLRAEARGVNFGKGDPKNRLRYFTKVGLLPHAQRQSFDGNSPSAAYPESVVNLLVEIDQKLRDGKTVQAILREKREEVRKVSSNPVITFLPFSLRRHSISPTTLPASFAKYGQQKEELEAATGHKSKVPFGLKPIYPLSLLFLLLSVTATPGPSVLDSNLKNIANDTAYSLKSLLTRNDLEPSSPFSLDKQVLAAIADSYLNINVETDVNGVLHTKGGIKSHGADADLETGRVFASNIIYNLVAGDNITVSDGQTPTISAAVNETLASVTTRGATTTTPLTLTGGATLGNLLNLGPLSSDPTSVSNGASYYNTTSKKFRCYQNGSWLDCITTDTTGSTSFTLAGSSGTSQSISSGDTLTIAAGNGVSTTAAATDTVTVDLDVITTSTTSTTSANSGLELTSAGLSLLRGCSASQVLQWNSGSSIWECTTLSSSGDITAVGNVLSGSAFTGSDSSADKGNNLIFEGSTSTDNATDITLTAADAATSRTFTLPDVASGNVCISNVSCIGTTGDSATSFFSTGTLEVTIGGTGAATFTSNGVLYGNGTGAIQVTSAGTNGQLLLGVTSGAPAFATMSGDATITNAGVLAIAADAVALTTDTTGNYVATGASGSGVSLTGGGSEGATLTAALAALTADWNQTGAFDITLNNASSELRILESAGAAFYGTVDVTDLSADRTYTFPDDTGTICLSSGNCAGGAGGSKWTNTGSLTYLTETTDSITVGSSTELAKIAADGDADEIQLLVQGNSTQTSNLVVFEQSDGTDVLALTNAGNLTLAGDAAVNGGDITSTSSTLTLGGSITTLNCADCIDFDDLDDTLDLDANLTLNQSTNTWTQNFTGTTTTGLTYNADSVNTGTGFLFSADALTTGRGVDVTSTSNALTTGDFFNVTVSQSAATGTSVSSDIVDLEFLPTYSTAVTTPTISGSILDIDRTVTTNSSFASTLTVSGAVVSITDTATQTTGTLTNTANVLSLTQSYSSASGAVLNIANSGTGADIAFNASPTLTISDTGTLTITDGTNTLFSLADGGTAGNLSGIGTLSLSGDITWSATTPSIAINNGESWTVTDGSNTLFTLADAGTTGNLTLSGDLNVNGGDINSTSSTLALGGSITTLNCADCIDFDDMEDTLDLDANLTLNQTTNTWSQSYTGTSGTAFGYTANSQTSGTVFSLTTNAGSSQSSTLALDINLGANVKSGGGAIDISGSSNPDGAGQTINFVNLTPISGTANFTETVRALNIQMTNNSIVAGSTQQVLRVANALSTNFGAGDLNTDALILLDNADTSTDGSTIVDNAILITNSGGVTSGITDAVDASATEIVNALNVGPNVITGTTGSIDFTNFDVADTGGVTFTGVTTDITTGTNETLTITPNGTGALAVTTAATTTDSFSFTNNSATTGDLLEIINGGSLTTGSAFNILSGGVSNAFTGTAHSTNNESGLFNVLLGSSSGAFPARTTAFVGDVGKFYFKGTYSAVTLTDSGSVLRAGRNLTTATSGTVTVSGSILNIENNFSQGASTTITESTTNPSIANFVQNCGTSVTCDADTVRISNASTGDLLVLNSTGAVTTDNGLAIRPTSASGTITDGIQIGSGTDTITNGINFGSTGITDDIVLQNAETINNDTNGTVLIEDGGATTLISASTTDFKINLDDTTTFSQRVCQSGADAATGVVDIGDCTAINADFAEYYGTDGSLEAGDVVAIDPDKSAQSVNIDGSGPTSKAWVKTSNIPYDQNLIGIVSTNPFAEILSERVFSGDEHPMPVALSGRVPTRVSTEGGPIEVGDPITSSSQPGVGMKATANGPVVGKALESYDSEGVGKIIVFVNLTYYFDGVTGGSQSAAEIANQGASAALTDTTDQTATSSATTSAVANTSSENLLQKITDVLESMGITVKNAVVSIKDALIDKLTVKIFTVDNKKKEDFVPLLGEGKITAGQKEVKIQNSLVKNNSKIFITFRGQAQDFGWSIKEILEGDSFTVEISKTLAQDLIFDYWVIQTTAPVELTASPKGSQAQTPPAVSQETPTPSPQESATPAQVENQEASASATLTP